MKNGAPVRQRHERHPADQRIAPPARPDVHNIRCRTLANGLLLLLWSGVTCAAALAAPRDVVELWKGDDQWVRIERQDDPAALPNDHPASLGTAAVANALGALRMRVVDPDTGAESQRPVFTHDELGRLAPPVALGLTKAGPRQDVTFSTLGSHARGTGDLIKAICVNAGRVFYEDGKLNVIFGELQTNYRKRNVYGRVDEDFNPRRQGLRVRTNKLSWTLAALPGIALHATGNGGVRDDWVTIDPAVAGSQAAAVPQAVAAVPGSSSLSAAASQPAQRSPPAPAAPPGPTANAAIGPGTTTTPESAPPNSVTDLERRLRILKEMRDKGLISQEIYDAKVRELLSEL